MRTIRGTFIGGRIILDASASWPEGSRVEVALADEGIGLREDEWPVDAQGLAELRARMEAMVAPH